MNRRRDLLSLGRTGFVLLAALAVLTAAIAAQDRLKSMPGYDQYLKMSKEMTGAVKPGSLSVSWKDPLTFEYTRDGKVYRYDVAKKTATEVGPAPEQAGGGMRGAGARGQGGAPERGRQVASATSPDGKLKAFYRDRNLWMSDAAGANEVARHDRRQREGPHQIRHRELGLRRRARPDDRDVVVARQHEARLLPLR